MTQGARAGELFRVLPWQRRLVRGIVRHRTSAITVGRGCGKTTLLAGVACAALGGPLRTRRGEVICVASSFSQARILFEHVVGFVGPILRAIEAVPDRQQRQQRDHRGQGDRLPGSVHRVRSRRAHGLAPVLVLADEPAQWEPSKSDAMRAALRTSLGKVPGSKFVALGTRPADHEHWFSRMLEGARTTRRCMPRGRPIRRSGSQRGARRTLPSITCRTFSK